MGLFDTEYVISVDVASSPLISEEYRTDFTKTAILEAILSEGEIEVDEALTNNFIEGYAYQMDKFWRKAKDVDELILPTEKHALPTFNNEDAVKAAIESVYGETLHVQTIVTKSPDAEYFAKWVLYRDYNLVRGVGFDDPNTNRNYDCIYDDARFTESGELIIYYLVTDPDTQESRDDMDQESMTLDFTHLDFSKDYIHVEFLRDTVARREGYWVYVPETAPTTFPDLDLDVVDTYDEDYYPILVIRNNFTDLHTTISETNRTKLDRALDLIGLDLATLHTEILKDTAENDTSKMEDVFLMFGVDVLADDVPSKHYLYHYFERLRQRQIYNKAAFNLWLQKNERNLQYVQRNYFTFKEDDSFKTAIFFNYIHRRMIARSLTEPELIVVVRPPVDAISGSKAEMSELKIRMPISDTHAIELSVHGLHQRHTVYDDPNGPDSKGMYLTLTDAKSAYDSGENRGIYLPVSRNTLLDVPIHYRNAIMQNTLRVLVYSSDVQKVKWYEQAAFLTVVQIVVIAVSIIFQQYQNVGWALALEVVKTAIINIIIGKLIVETLELVVDIIGLENTAFAAALMIVVAIAWGVGADEAAMQSVTRLLQVADATITAGMNVAEDMYADLVSEYTALQQEYSDAYDLLQETNIALNSGLDTDYLINTIVNTSTTPMYYEKPDAFYARTLQINKADTVINAVGRFTETMLTLPKEVDLAALTDLDRSGMSNE